VAPFFYNFLQFFWQKTKKNENTLKNWGQKIVWGKILSYALRTPLLRASDGVPSLKFPF
jgi:hypothetical protein